MGLSPLLSGGRLGAVFDRPREFLSTGERELVWQAKFGEGLDSTDRLFDLGTTNPSFHFIGTIQSIPIFLIYRKRAPLPEVRAKQNVLAREPKEGLALDCGSWQRSWVRFAD
ncbi:hypothetical protein MPNT_110039 [Candidatus Methylacidithermus pantelleriae]|uniref:Uncharacterized protein n=1 Tax=Candidatus Methylacidithermus pantelleriae TaxID=2744239 RepID=A0A8J2BMD2_9BACT|nr:hypothetical protein MPNT_110039 [Candidatus Methylacidithermus pantelleriae]